MKNMGEGGGDYVSTLSRKYSLISFEDRYKNNDGRLLTMLGFCQNMLSFVVR